MSHRSGTGHGTLTVTVERSVVSFELMMIDVTVTTIAAASATNQAISPAGQGLRT